MDNSSSNKFKSFVSSELSCSLLALCNSTARVVRVSVASTGCRGWNYAFRKSGSAFGMTVCRFVRCLVYCAALRVVCYLGGASGLFCKLT